MTDGEFYEAVVHTPRGDVPAMRDRSAGQVLLKMAALGEAGGQKGTRLTVRFTRDLGLELVTPLGTYSFLLDPRGQHLVVEQVL